METDKNQFAVPYKDGFIFRSTKLLITFLDLTPTFSVCKGLPHCTLEHDGDDASSQRKEVVLGLLNRLLSTEIPSSSVSSLLNELSIRVVCDNAACIRGTAPALHLKWYSEIYVLYLQLSGVDPQIPLTMPDGTTKSSWKRALRAAFQEQQGLNSDSEPESDCYLQSDSEWADEEELGSEDELWSSDSESESDYSSEELDSGDEFVMESAKPANVLPAKDPRPFRFGAVRSRGSSSSHIRSPMPPFTFALDKGKAPSIVFRDANDPKLMEVEKLPTCLKTQEHPSLAIRSILAGTLSIPASVDRTVDSEDALCVVKVDKEQCAEPPNNAMQAIVDAVELEASDGPNDVLSDTPSGVNATESPRTGTLAGFPHLLRPPHLLCSCFYFCCGCCRNHPALPYWQVTHMQQLQDLFRAANGASRGSRTNLRDEGLDLEVVA